MISLYRTVTTRYLRRRRMRSALIVTSITLGVAMLVGTRILQQTMGQAARGAVAPLAGVADLMLDNGDTGIPLSLAREIRDAKIPGVQNVHPLVMGFVGLPDLKAESIRPKILGVELETISGQDNPWNVQVKLGFGDVAAKSWSDIFAEAILLAKEKRRTALVGRDLAPKIVDPLGRFRITAANKEHLLWAVGTVTADGHAAFLSGNALVLRLEDASQVLFPDRPDFITRIDMTFEPGADREQIRQRVEALVGTRAIVLTPEVHDRSITAVTGGLELGSMLTGAAALIVGLFLVYNALAVSVAERRHDVGILRSLGATRWQVAALFAGEAGLLGLIGSAIGIPLGWGSATLFIGPLQKLFSEIFVPMESRGVPLGLDTIVIALFAGLATALLAALVPALRAAAVAPADAVRRTPLSERLLFRMFQGGGGATLVLIGIVLLLLRERLPARLGTFGGVGLMWLGCLVATPVLAAIFSRLLQPFTRTLLPVEGRLAADNLARSSARTGLVIAALAAGVNLIIATAGQALSIETALLHWIDHRIAADLFVTGHSPFSTGGQTLPMEEELGTRIANDPVLQGKIEQVVPNNLHEVIFRGEKVFMIAFDTMKAYRAIRHRTTTVPAWDLYPRMRQQPGTVLVSENFAALYGVRVGDNFSLPGKDGKPVDLHVIGIVVDFTWIRGTIMMDREYFKERIGNNHVDLYHVYASVGDNPNETIEDIASTIRRRWGAGYSDQDIVVMTRPELREDVRRLLSQFFTIPYAQLLVVALVVALGVVASLLISVLQRQREIGLLRAVGASSKQILVSVLTEALLMGLIGSLIGVAVGIPLEWLCLRYIFVEETGLLYRVRIPWLSAGVVVTLSLAVATLAGLLPAIRAMRLRIAEAIAYE